MFYAIQTARVILGDRIFEKKRVTESRQQRIKSRDDICCTLTLGERSTNQESNPKEMPLGNVHEDHSMARSPNWNLLIKGMLHVYRHAQKKLQPRKSAS